MPDKRVVFGSAYQAMWAWVRETDPDILHALLGIDWLAESATVHLNGYDHLWHKVIEAARVVLDDPNGAHPYFT